ncbi:MAG: methyltransferase domain-containing protein [Phycisphaerales bacterium]|nr:MAG: methyltransferase domain-containing protein [Phycisphaerales bacterium]
MNAWEEFFDQYANRYDQEPYTKNTEAEVEFIVEHAAPPTGGAILDMGCGTGRHSVALAQRGYQVTGVDLSRGMLAIAAQRAQAASAAVEWVHANAADFVRPDSFDAVICLCEGAMCLLTDDENPLERDMAVLANIRRSLRSGGTLILNVLNACRVIRSSEDQAVRDGTFDPENLTHVTDVSQCLPDAPNAHRLRERYYTAPEIRRMVQAAGMTVRGVYGGTAGN